MARSTLVFVALAIFASLCVDAASDCVPGCKNGGVCTAVSYSACYQRSLELSGQAVGAWSGRAAIILARHYRYLNL
jgi:hypothetical protein